MTKMTDGMRWFKTSFSAPVGAAIANTPFTLNLMTALAVQESFEVWGNLFQTAMLPGEILDLCVGDTIDGPGRKAFPTSKANLLAATRGSEIFAAARASLEAVGTVNATYHKIFLANPNKFCHGFGIFQLDIQFCKQDPDYFINHRWKSFDICLGKAIDELKAAQGRAKLDGKAVLTDLELAHVAIAYNAGSFDPARGLKQGHMDSSGKFYGELIAQFIALAATV